MDQQTPTTSISTLTVAAASSSSTTTTTAQSTEPSPSPAPQPSAPPPTPPPQLATPQPPSSAAPSIPTPNPNPNSNLPPKPSTSLTQPQSQTTTTASTATTRPHTLHRPWQHPHPHAHSQFTPHSSPSSLLSPSSSTSVPLSASQPRGGVAIGVPAAHPTPPPPSFSSSFGQQYGGLNRGVVNVPESVPNTSTSQVRQGMQGIQGMGMMGSMNSSSQMRPGGIPAHHQQRPVQSSLRPPSSSPNSQPPTSQNFQGHGFMRSSPLVPPSSSVPSTSQSVQSPTQPWLSSGSQGKPPLPSPSYRAQINTPSMQQRSHAPQQQQQHPLPTTSQLQHIAPVQPQPPLPSHPPPDHYGQQFPPSRIPQSVLHPQQATRIQGSVSQKPSSTTMVQPNTVQSMPQSRIATIESDESGNRILSKRSIHELVSQIDPSERLDPEVEDILADIADEFVDSITTFGCSLAKHRKSDTLEAKDILLHLERNWNVTLPGFGGDEIKTYRKPLTNDIHKERLAVIKKTILASEMANAKNAVGQAAGNAKSNVTKTPTNALVSSNLKVP